MNASPQMILALLRQLVHAAGVHQQDISVGDPLCLFPNQYYDPLHCEFPNVHYLDHDGGNADHPRTRVQYSSIPFHWSSRPTGTAQDYVPVPYAEAKYLINMANLKSHTGAGVTLCGKNHYGSLIRKPPDKGYYDMHGSLPEGIHGSGALPGRRGPDGARAHRRQDPALFNRRSVPGSASHRTYSPQVVQPPLSTGNGLPAFLPPRTRSLSIPWPSISSGLNGTITRTCPEPTTTCTKRHWRINPPSGTFYDPDHATNTTRLASLGVHEHWNNAQEKQYSRNLGKEQGIELVRFGPSAA